MSLATPGSQDGTGPQRPAERRPTPERLRKQETLRAALQDRIAAMHAGEPLPSERDLARELGIARMTLRRAVDRLVADGRLIRRQGAGTFVAPARVDQELSATSFSEDMRSRGLTPGATTLWSRTVPAGLAMASIFRIRPQDHVLHVRRLRTADGIPMAVEDLHLPSALAPGLTGEDLQDRSFYEVLGTGYDIRVASGTQTVEPTLVIDEDAEPLAVPPGSPAFLFERTSTDPEGRVVEFVRSIYRGDRYRIVVDIYPRHR